MKCKPLIKLLLFATAFRAHAFPEMVRHGYAQCTACHVSVSGGGTLTPYGRQLSAELLSTWNYTNESSFLHGALKKDLSESGLLFGGDVRSIQTYEEDRQSRDGKLFVMQADFQTAYIAGPFTAFMSVGQITSPLSGGLSGNLNSTSFYGQYQATETLSVRAGRFLPSYGINMPDHTVVTKSGLGLGPGRQFDTAEVNALGESYTLSASLAQTPQAKPRAQRETDRTLNGALNFAQRFRVGASLRTVATDSDRRTFYGAYGILGFTKSLFTLSEVDLSNSLGVQSFFALSRWGYEITKGVVPYLQFQYMNRGASGLAKFYSGGVSFYPRPHFELLAEWTHAPAASGDSEEAFLLAHYYF